MKKKILSALLCAALILGNAAGVLAAPQPMSDRIVRNDGLPVTCLAFVTGLRLEAAQGESARLTRSGEEIGSAAYVATGQTLEWLNVAGEVVRRENVIVMGDVLGTGIAGSDQVRRLAVALNGSEPLDGIWRTAGDLDGSGAIDFADLLIARDEAAALQNGEGRDLSAAEVTAYMMAPDDTQTQTLVFIDGRTDIPYVSMDSAIALYSDCSGADLDVLQQDGVYLLRKENGTFAEFNFYDGSIVFSDYDDFFRRSYQSTILDPTGNVPFLTRPEGSFERFGYAVAIDLRERGIETVYREGTGYLPLQTFADIFLSTSNLQYLYNGRACFLVGGAELGPLSDLYYSAPPGERSDALAQFNYDELCLALDMRYGLQEQHDISGFDAFFIQTGLKPRLLSPDPVEADAALAELAAAYLGDLHSVFHSASWYAGAEAEIEPDAMSQSVLEMMRNMEQYESARMKYYPDGAPAYEEIGDVAIVTIDSFRFTPGADYSERPLTPYSSDTIDIIRYAHSQITRDGSPVEKVVIDLSNNTGGSVDAALAVISWYLGGATLNLNSSMTRAQASTRYKADINMDGVVDKNDSVVSKRRYCLTSPLSFSCGNMVPAAFKSSGAVTLAGRNSSGGACIVQPIGTADGSLMQISGPLRMSVLSNGSYYDLDRGVDVDIPIVNIENFYDREVLIAYLNSLVR